MKSENQFTVPITQMIHDWAMEAARISLTNDETAALSPAEIAEKVRTAYHEAREPLLERLRKKGE